jgi:hypothetical protein
MSEMKTGTLRFTAALMVMAVAAPAYANVTAKDVWEAWKAQAASMGQTLTVGSEVQTGDTLEVKGVVANFEGPTGKGTATWGDLSLKELGDGTVQVIFPADYPLTFAGTDAAGTETSGTISLKTTGLNLVASGDPGAINYALNADELTMALSGLKTAGEDIPLNISAVLKGAAGGYKTTSGTDFTFDVDVKAASMDLLMDGTDPTTGEQFKLTGSATDITLLEKGKFPAGTNMQDMNAALKAGMEMSGTVSTGAANYVMDVQGGMDPFSGAFTAASSAFDFAMANGGMKYSGSTKGMDFSVTSMAMPMPVAAKMDEMVFGIIMPMVKTDASQDIGGTIKLVGLTVGEEIWAMFDPGKVLPRDPATLIFDVAGKGKWTADIMDPVAAAAVTGTPVEMESLNVNEIRVAVAGADVSGTGALTFDNAMTAMGGPPMPLGSINVKAIGVNGFLDKMVQMGFIPQDQLMGMKMMMGMFAKPGAEPDSLESLIEFKEGGQVFANGTPLQ